MLKAGAAIFAATMFVNAAMFVFHVTLSRALGVQSYGILYTLISAATFIAVVAGILTIVVARLVAEASVSGGKHILSALAGSSLKRGAIGGVLACAVLALLVLPVRAFLHLPDAGPLWALALFALVQFALAAARGVLQGLQRFGPLAVSLVSEAAIRTAAGVWWGAHERSITLAIAAYGAGAAIALVYTLVAVFRAVRPTLLQTGVQTAGVVRLSFGAAASTLAVAALGIADVVLVRHYFNNAESSVYAAVSLVGKVVYLATGFLPTIVLPKATATAAAGRSALRVLLPAGAVFAVLGAVTLTAFALFPEKIVTLVAGSQYASAAPYLFRYAIAMTMLGATNALVAYRIALNNFSFIPASIALVLIQAAAIALYHGSLGSVIAIVIGTNAMIFAVVTTRLPRRMAAADIAVQGDPVLIAREVETI